MGGLSLERTVRLAVWAAGVAVVCAMLPAARAADWRFTPTLTAQETYTDNVFLAPVGGATGLTSATTGTVAQQKESDFISEVIPGFSVNGRGGRASVAGTYSLDKGFFADHSDRDFLRQTFSTANNLEFWQKQAFIDARANMSCQSVNPLVATSELAAGQQVNSIDVLNTDVTPYFLHHFGGWVETRSEVGYRTFSTSNASPGVTTATASTPVSSSPFSNVAPAGSQTIHSAFTANTGHEFTQTKLTFRALRDKIMRDNDLPHDTITTENLDLTQIISPEWSLLGGVGRQDIEDATLLHDFHGFSWNAGAAWQPGRRTNIRATVGETVIGTTYDFTMSHQFSERTSFNASYHEAVITEQAQQSTNLGFLGTDVTGSLINTQTGQPFTGSTNPLGLQNSAFIQKRFQAGLNGSRGRTSFSVTAVHETRDFQAAGTLATTFQGTVNFTRQLSSRSSLTGSINYFNIDSGQPTNETINQVNLTASWRYQIGPYLSSNLSYRRTQRDLNISTDSTSENAVVLGLTQTF